MHWKFSSRDGERVEPVPTIGVDVGTQGVRAMIVDESGDVLGHSSYPFPGALNADARFEQNPHLWWSAVRTVIGDVVKRTSAHSGVTAISVTATSGTLVLTDGRLEPVRNAIMWDDRRALDEANEVRQQIGDRTVRPTFALPKAMWVRRNEPDVWSRVRYILSPADWLSALLRAESPVTDFTNALKAGVDLETLSWGAPQAVGIDPTVFPDIAVAGTDLGKMDPDCARELGLRGDVCVVLGATDATAGFIAAGGGAPGVSVTTIGTGLSLKTASDVRWDDPDGAIYSHRHWDHGWIVTGTSHCGGDALTTNFTREELAASSTGPVEPTSMIVLPLSTRGEFFPFSHSAAKGFEVGRAKSRADLLCAYFEGLAYVERLGLEKVSLITAGPIRNLSTVGGGATNDRLMSIRAAVMGIPTHRPSVPAAAFGAAIIAASIERGITETARRMVRSSDAFDPEPKLSVEYEDRYGRFLEELTARGYLSGERK